jgi:type IV secretion/conjugal transfer VirB4 family ATPase
MHALKAYRDPAKGLPDLLDWAALIESGFVQGKNGSLMAGFFYRGHDIASSTEAERNYITGRVNAAFSRLGSGWVTWHDAVRLPAAAYPPPEASHFPDAISRLIDEERRERFLAEGKHFESEYALLFYYLPPLRRHTRIQDFVWEEDPAAEKKKPADQVLAYFRKTLEDVEDALGDVVKLRRMQSYRVTDAFHQDHLQDELVNYLNFCLTGDETPVNIPPCGMYMDAYIGGKELWTGDTPRIGNRYVCCVAIEGFPHESYPNILEILEHLPIAYRWSTRMIYLDAHEAIQELKKYRRKWKQKVRGFWAQVFRTSGGIVNEDALLMATQSETAINDAHSALVVFGYYTPVIVLMGEDRSQLLENARSITREIQRIGFECRVESVNAMEAWRGALPGHPMPNIRRPLIHTLNLADLVPLSSVWAGHDVNPCPLYPENSPPLLHAATAGATPFRLNLHIGDLGHTLVFGPTGAGKSVLLNLLAAQFRRYQGKGGETATICAFDKGRSMWALVNACGGKHYDIASDQASLAFAPLSFIDSDSDMAWAEEWLGTCYELQTGSPPLPRQREEIHRAVRLMRDEKVDGERSLTDFCLTVQDHELRAALSHYTIDGPLGNLLDSSCDGLHEADFTVFEIDDLMGFGEKNLIPVLLYLFRRFEKSLAGQPALLALDEAWVMLGHPVFREKIREWLKVLRKANCAVVLATQSLSDAVKSGLFDVLIESCPTKILLPNEQADKSGTKDHPGPRDLYTLIGLNETQIEILKTAIKKRHYYYLSPEGRRLFDLGLGAVALAFVGVSDKETLAHLRQLMARYGPNWPFVWLNEKGIPHEALQT